MSSNIISDVPFIKGTTSTSSTIPQFLSYEGSVMLCVMLSLNNKIDVPLINFPLVDQKIIDVFFGNDYGNDIKSVVVRFDADKNFIFSFTYGDMISKVITFINTVLHPRPDDLKDIKGVEVPIENHGDKVSIGNNIVMDKESMRDRIGLDKNYLCKTREFAKKLESIVPEIKKEQFNPAVDSILPQRRKLEGGKNAFEIRNDVLSMALDFIIYQKRELVNEDDVISTAKKFYSFVENRR